MVRVFTRCALSRRLDSRSALRASTLYPSYARFMRLSTVHLKDYKSYRGSVTVGPFASSLSTIVGPNGAGKSTVIDGILFALGASATEGGSIAINHACGSDECSVAVVLVGDASPTRLTVQRR